MTREELTQINWKRLGSIFGAMLAFWLLLTAAASVLDGRYVKREQYQADVLQIKADLRVLRCQLVRDCP